MNIQEQPNEYNVPVPNKTVCIAIWTFATTDKTGERLAGVELKVDAKSETLTSSYIEKQSTCLNTKR